MSVALSPERFLRIDEVARLLGVSPKTIRRWIESEALPAHRLGPRSLRVSEVEVLAWVEAR